MSLIREALEKSAKNQGKVSPLLKQEEMIEKDLVAVRLKAREQMMARRRLRMGIILLCVLGLVFGLTQFAMNRQTKTVQQRAPFESTRVETSKPSKSFFTPAKPRFVLTGITLGSEGNIAIINGETVQEGDFLGDYVVLRISKSVVTLRSQDKTLQISL